MIRSHTAEAIRLLRKESGGLQEICVFGIFAISVSRFAAIISLASLRLFKEVGLLAAIDIFQFFHNLHKTFSEVPIAVAVSLFKTFSTPLPLWREPSRYIL